MPSVLNEDSRRGLLANVALFVGGALAINALIFLSGWDASSAVRQQALVPPGPVIGAIWVVLFGLMALSRWYYVVDARGPHRLALFPVALAILCLGYPIYTGGLSDERIGYIAAVVLLFVTLAIIVALARRSRRSGTALLPTAAWLGYVSLVGLIS